MYIGRVVAKEQKYFLAGVGHVSRKLLDPFH